MSTAAEKLKATLIKTIGENDGGASVHSWIDTGFAPLNHKLSGRYDGGYGLGRLYEMFGPSSAGKTILATKAMIAAQRAGGCAVFIDYEQSFDLALGIELGLNPEMPYFIYKAPRTWEEGNGLAVETALLIRESEGIPNDAPIFIVQDSIAAAVPKSMAEKGAKFDMYNMNDTTALARVASTTLKSMKLYAAESQFTCLYLNQIRTKPGVMFGDPTTTPGGVAMEFYASGRISLSRSNTIAKDGSGIEEQTIKANVVKSKHTKPFQRAEWSLKFREDGVAWFDTETSTVEYMRDAGLIEKAGNFLVWDGKKYYPKQLGELIRKNGEQDKLTEMLLGTEEEG